MIGARVIQPPVTVTVTVPAVVHEALADRARALGVPPEAYVQRILDAAIDMVRAIGVRNPVELPAAALPIEAAAAPAPSLRLQRLARSLHAAGNTAAEICHATGLGIDQVREILGEVAT